MQNICSSSSSLARKKDLNCKYRDTCCCPYIAVTAVGNLLPVSLWNCLSTSHPLWLILVEYRPIHGSTGFLSHFFRDFLFKTFFLNRTSGFREWAKKAIPYLVDHGEICTLGRLHGHGTYIQIWKDYSLRKVKVLSFCFDKSNNS